MGWPGSTSLTMTRHEKEISRSLSVTLCVQVLMGVSRSALQARELFNIYAGDRLATLMGYLSHVPAGGYTVFPMVGAYVRPVKGSVVLWWNMDKNGGYDDLVKHGGCPVLIGS